MNNTTVIPFHFNSKEVRVIKDDLGDPWFVGKDVAEQLGYADTVNAIKLHCKGVAKYHPLKTTGGTQNVRIINESDLYRLVAKSELPAAQEFESWIFDEVLPTIRKTGGYSVSQSDRPSFQYQEAASIAESILHIGKLFGTAEPMARAIAAEEARRETGVNLFKMLPIETVPEVPVGVRELAKATGLKQNQCVAALLNLGIATRDSKGNLILSDFGRSAEAGSMEPYKSRNSDHTGYRVLWFKSKVIPLIQTREV